MRHGMRCSSILLASALLLCFGASSAAQQIRFEDFSDAKYANTYLFQNYSYKEGNSPYLTTYGMNSVLRLTEGARKGIQASTVYFNVEQPLTAGFTTYFEFQTHNPTTCCSPGDGIAFIIQNANAVDSTMGATWTPGKPVTALGAGGNTSQAGAMGYAGINESLVVEFDIHQDAWDPTANHIAVQTCGPPTESNQNYNTPVHDPGVYQIGDNDNVTSCLYMNAITSNIPMIGGACTASQVCADGKVHKVAMVYTSPANTGTGSGLLRIWFDTTFFDDSHTPSGPPTLSVPLTIEDEIDLDSSSETCSTAPATPCAFVGFTASQPSEGTVQDILLWEFTPSLPTQITQTIQPGLVPTVFAFGSHEADVTYPLMFSNPDGILMTFTATPTPSNMFYMDRLMGTKFADEQCITYLGTGQMRSPLQSGTCIVYSVACSLPDGTGIPCPQELMCDPSNGLQCIDIQTKLTTINPVNGNNADFLEAPHDTNDWCSIFKSFTPPLDNPLNSGPPGKGTGFIIVDGKGTGFSDLVATYRPGQGEGLSLPRLPRFDAACPP